jgi:hypothetical protein
MRITSGPAMAEMARRSRKARDDEAKGRHRDPERDMGDHASTSSTSSRAGQGLGRVQ